MTVVTVFWVAFTAAVHGCFTMLGAALGIALAVAFIGLIIGAIISGMFSQAELGC